MAARRSAGGRLRSDRPSILRSSTRSAAALLREKTERERDNCARAPINPLSYELSSHEAARDDS